MRRSQPSEPTSLPIAVRVYPRPKKTEQDFDKPKRKWRVPEAMFVFDTESSVDQTQRLKFGSYRFLVAGRCLKEGLFYADDLQAKDLRVLQQYVATHQADVVEEGLSRLLLLTRVDLVKELFRDAYKARCLLVGFNLPFDLSRVAYDVTDARRRFAGGFSLGLWSYIAKDGTEQAHHYRQRVVIKHIDSKRALKGFTDRGEPDDSDLIPEGSTTGQPEEDYKFSGHFLDLRTLAYALTDRGYSLEDACKDFNVEHGKQPAARHGSVTEEYIDYNRRDVLATSELAVKLLEEYGQHPINLPPTYAYSPASIGKDYLRTMGTRPVLERQPKFPKRYLGHAQSAFYGGRTSAHIRKVPVPVVYSDFLSMYPTVNSLMDLWRFVIAHKIKVIEHCGKEVQAFLGQLTADGLFDPATWKHLTGFVRIMPDGDILPSRGKYSVESNDWQVAVNHLNADGNDPKQALWFSIPDVAASAVLTGRAPTIIDAFRIEPKGTLRGLKPTKLRGAIEVKPEEQDFFKVVIEQRKSLSIRADISEREKKRLDKALKVLANATSYGIYAEMHRLESDRKTKVTCHGIDARPFTCRVAHPDEPGAYCFPPLASLITGAARLMLALLEHCVQNQGGTYAMEDTDSMAIVATKRGGMVRCPGGHGDMVKALSWVQVDEIAKRFSPLNPYDRRAVPGSILKIEDDNYDPKTEKQRQLYCLAISAKRYALFSQDSKGAPILLRKGTNNKENRWSEHGLGHLLNPTDTESEDRDWIAQAWLRMIRKSLGLSVSAMGFESAPAVGRVTVSSRAVMRPLEKLNDGKNYCDQIKPFNFLLTCHVNALGHPPGVDPARFHLISPYDTDSRQWLEKSWIDQYSQETYRITTTGYHGSRQTARVKTFGDVLTEYEYHPESKCADGNGEICKKQTVGLLRRRHVRIDEIKYIGKESNSLEEVESGLMHSEENVYTEYPDPRRDKWETKIVPALGKLTLHVLEKESRLSRRMLIDARTGHRKPHPRNQELLTRILQKHGLI